LTFGLKNLIFRVIGVFLYDYFDAFQLEFAALAGVATTLLRFFFCLRV